MWKYMEKRTCKRCLIVKAEDGRHNCAKCSTVIRIKQRAIRALHGVTNKQRKVVISVCGNACLICHSTSGITIDHVRPVSKGGTGDYSNLQVLCNSCNLSKMSNDRDYRTDGMISQLVSLKRVQRTKRNILSKPPNRVYSLTLNAGSNHDGVERIKAYRRAAEAEGITLNAWMKKAMDERAKFSYEKDSPTIK